MTNLTSTPIGAVASLWRYPVKSMLGEKLETADVTDGGFFGDRAYALIEQSSGKVASAKHARKWGKLFNFRATLIASPRNREQIPPVQITLPDRTVVTSEQTDVNTCLSHALAREVTLTTTRPEVPRYEHVDAFDPTETVIDSGSFMMRGRFSDYAAVHLLTTASLARLQELYPQGNPDLRRFRPNIVVETAAGEKDFVENAWVGHTLMIGDEVQLNITDPCPRCVMTTLAQEGLPQDVGVLRTLAQHNQVSIPAFGGVARPSVGVMAFVIRGGTIRCGDPIRIE